MQIADFSTREIFSFGGLFFSRAVAYTKPRELLSAMFMMALFSLSSASALDTVQDFLIKLGIKPWLHILKISIFLLNHVIVRPTKIMNRADKNWAHF